MASRVQKCPECGKRFDDISAEIWPRVLGAHRMRMHGVKGSGVTARSRARRKAREATKTATSLLPSSKQFLAEFSHVSYKRTKVNGPVVSLDDAITALRVEMDAMATVIEKLEAMQKIGRRQ